MKKHFLLSTIILAMVSGSFAATSLSVPVYQKGHASLKTYTISFDFADGSAKNFPESSPWGARAGDSG